MFEILGYLSREVYFPYNQQRGFQHHLQESTFFII